VVSLSAPKRRDPADVWQRTLMSSTVESEDLAGFHAAIHFAALYATTPMGPQPAGGLRHQPPRLGAVAEKAKEAGLPRCPVLVVCSLTQLRRSS
jgi:hypothetical protein